MGQTPLAADPCWLTIQFGTVLLFSLWPPMLYFDARAWSDVLEHWEGEGERGWVRGNLGGRGGGGDSGHHARHRALTSTWHDPLACPLLGECGTASFLPVCMCLQVRCRASALHFYSHFCSYSVPTALIQYALRLRIGADVCAHMQVWTCTWVAHGSSTLGGKTQHCQTQ